MQTQIVMLLEKSLFIRHIMRRTSGKFLHIKLYFPLLILKEENRDSTRNNTSTNT